MSVDFHTLKEKRFQLALLLILISSKYLIASDVQKMHEMVRVIFDDDPEEDFSSVLMSALERYIPEAPLLEPLLHTLKALVPSTNWLVAARALELQRKLVEARSGGFNTATTNAYHLPNIDSIAAVD